MERNIDDFLADPEQKERIESFTEEQFYETLENEIYEAIMSSIVPFQNNNVKMDGGEKLAPLSRQKAARDYAYKGPGTSVIRRSDKLELSKNKDLNITKTAVRSAFKAIIAASNKTSLGSQITSILRQTEKRIFQQIDQKLKAEKKNGTK